MAILSPQCPNSCFNNAFLKDSSSGELLKREQRIRAFFLSSMSCGSFVKKDSPFVILSRSVFLQFSIIPSTNPNLPSSIKLKVNFTNLFKSIPNIYLPLPIIVLVAYLPYFYISIMFKIYSLNRGRLNSIIPRDLDKTTPLSTSCFL